MPSLKKLVLVAASVALALSAATVDAEQHRSNHVRVRVSTNAQSADDVNAKHAPAQGLHLRDPESPPPVTRYPVPNPPARPTPTDPESPPPVTRYPVPNPPARPTPTEPESPPPVTRAPQNACEKKGMTKVYVQGIAKNFFCVSGLGCIGNHSGACPGTGRYRALPNGSTCVKVGTTYTCKAN